MGDIEIFSLTKGAASCRFICVLLANLAAVPAIAGDLAGLSVGVLFGHQSGTASQPALPPSNGDIDLPVAGNIVGVEAGYTHQFDSGLVLGLSADIARTATSGQHWDGLYMYVRGEGDIEAHLLARIGYAIDNLLPYVTGGLGYARTTAALGCVDGASKFSMCDVTGPFHSSADDARFGYSIGAGVEIALTDQLSLKAEYLYADYGTGPITLDVPGFDPVTSDVTISSSTIRTGISLRF